MSLRGSILTLLVVAQVAPLVAQSPQAGSWLGEVRRLRSAPVARRTIRTPVPSRRTATVGETEPNDAVANADAAALGARGTGALDPAGDEDTWFVDLAAGQLFSVDVDASQFGSPLDPTLALLSPDGRNLLAFNDDFDEFDSRISFHVPAGGRYFVRIAAFGDVGDPTLTYAINFGTFTCDPEGTEREPNDTPGTASALAVGGNGLGQICRPADDPAGDEDYWAFTAQAGTTIELDVDAFVLGVFSDPFLELFAGDGTTLLAFNDDIDGPDSRLQYSITATGTYFAKVTTLFAPGGNPFPYILHLRTLTQGPGDPIAARAGDLGQPLALAAGSAGDLFTTDVFGGRILRISGQGVVSSFVPEIVSPFGLAFDPFGSLLVASGDGIVYRVDQQGRPRRFIEDAGVPFWIAVAPDGRIWLSDLADGSLRRYSPSGRFEARVDVSSAGGFGPGPLAIGPSGEPYFSVGTQIWRLANGEPELVATDPGIIWGFAFDQAGNIYAPVPAVGRIKLFNAAGNPVADPFAVGLGGPQAVAFGRDQAGATVARLFASDLQGGRLIEMNPAGVARPGLPVGFTVPFGLDVAAATLLGAGGLAAADLRFIDALGNGNGRFDVGDFQAFLRAEGGLPGAAASRREEAGP